jgi:hypothetical protein
MIPKSCCLLSEIISSCCGKDYFGVHTVYFYVLLKLPTIIVV